MRSRQNDDEQIILDAKYGSTESFGLLYERYAESIYRFIFSHLDNRQDAEDLTEDIFFRAWKALSTYDERGLPFSAFLFQVARNTLIDFYRQHRTLQPIDEIEIQSGDIGPEQMVYNKQENEGLVQCLGKLREDYRTVLILRFLSGLTIEETADAMRRSEGAVRVLQHRALSALKEVVEKGEHEQQI